MLRMEIALFLVLGFVAYIYFSAERKHTPLHRTFSVLLVVVLIHLVFDGLTIYTVNNLDTVPRLLNDVLHRIFVGSMVLVMYLFYQYIKHLLFLRFQLFSYFLSMFFLLLIAKLPLLKKQLI